MNNKTSAEFFSGERLYLGKTEIDPLGLSEHMSRYQFAKKHVPAGAAVLDAACGTGYGSEILAQAAGKVVGFEFSEHAIAWANEHHKKPNLEYVQGDLNKPLAAFADKTFDIVVSFETLEHIANQENMLSEFKRVLKRDGTLILSSPDREIITGKAHTENKFHINELSKREFIDKLGKYFSITEVYGQTKYVPLPWYKKLVKLVAKLDVFKLRRSIVRMLGLKAAVHKALAPFSGVEIERVSLEEPSAFFVLIAVCKNR